MTATPVNDILRARGHEPVDGMCPKCWGVADSLYAGGQGAYESKTDAYYAALRYAEDDARKAANTTEER